MSPTSAQIPGVWQVEAVTSFGGDAPLPFWILALILGLVILALWSASIWSRECEAWGAVSPFGRLFLGVRFRAQDGGQSLAGHVLSLDLRSATIVSPSPVARQGRIQLSLDSLPGYPETNAPIVATVTSCRAVVGLTDSYLLSVRFLPIERDLRGALARYIDGLSRHSSWSHA